MKKLMFSVLAAGTMMFTISSCTKTCDKGLEGSDCKTEMRTKFLGGTINASDSKNGGTAFPYSTSITSSSSDISTVLISKVAGSTSFFNSSVKATVDGTKLTIADQTPDGDAYHISGSASVSGKVITITYAISGPNNATPPVTVTDNYSGTWTVQ